MSLFDKHLWDDEGVNLDRFNGKQGHLIAIIGFHEGLEWKWNDQIQMMTILIQLLSKPTAC